MEPPPETRAIVPIRYDGLDAERHQIDLNLLGESLQGAGRILATVGHFVATQQYQRQLQTLDVKVYVDEPKANCWTIPAMLTFAKEQQLFAGIAAVVLAPILTWIFAKASNDRAEMKAVKDSLDKAIAQLAGQNSELIPKLLATVDKLAESLRPSVRSMVAPIGRTCTHVTVGGAPPIDPIKATAIRAPVPDEVTHERAWDIVITEMDHEGSTAKVRLVDENGMDDRRVKAVITDPLLEILGNPYVQAFAAHAEIRVRGKAVLRDGEIQTLHISDIDSKPAT